MAVDPSSDYRRLSVAERLQLVEDIRDSIAADASADSLPLSEEEQALLDERLADLEDRPDAGASWAEVRERIVKRPR